MMDRSLTPIDRAERLASRVAASEAKVGVLGLGVVGSLTLRLILEAGLRVCGYDRDPQRVKSIRSEIEGRPDVGADPALLADADVLIIAVRVAIAEDGRAELEALRAAARTISGLPLRDRIVLLETTVPAGTTRRLASEWLSTSGGEITLVGYCPERLREGDDTDRLRAVPRLLGGVTEDATRIGCSFLSSLGVTAVPVAKPEVAELSKLLENAFLTTGITLMGEVTRIAHEFGIDATDVANAAATKPHGYFPFYPGAGIGGHCLPNDLAILRRTAVARDVQSPFLDGLSAASAHLTTTVLRRFRTLMEREDVQLEGSRVWVIGVGFKPGSRDTTRSAATEAIRELKSSGARVMYSDSLVPNFEVDGEPVPRIPSSDYPGAVDAVLILSGDSAIPLAEITARSSIVLDAGGAHTMMGDRNGVAHL